MGEFLRKHSSLLVGAFLIWVCYGELSRDSGAKAKKAANLPIIAQSFLEVRDPEALPVAVTSARRSSTSPALIAAASAASSG